MREPSLRPERSASANSATSAGGPNFIAKENVVNLERGGKDQSRAGDGGQALTGTQWLLTRALQRNLQVHYGVISVPLGDATIGAARRYIDQRNRKEAPMFVVAGVVCLVVLLALSGADLLVSDISSDELSNMGVERKS